MKYIMFVSAFFSHVEYYLNNHINYEMQTFSIGGSGGSGVVRVLRGLL